MNFADIIVLAAVLLLVVFAVWRIRKSKGACSCGCGCSGSCEGCNQVCNVRREQKK